MKKKKNEYRVQFLRAGKVLLDGTLQGPVTQQQMIEIEMAANHTGEYRMRALNPLAADSPTAPVDTVLEITCNAVRYRVAKYTGGDHAAVGEFLRAVLSTVKGSPKRMRRGEGETQPWLRPEDDPLEYCLTSGWTLEFPWGEMQMVREGTLSKVDSRIGSWLSAALDDPKVCAEMKQDIHDWMRAHPGPLYNATVQTGRMQCAQSNSPARRVDEVRKTIVPGEVIHGVRSSEVDQLLNRTWDPVDARGDEHEPR